MEIKRVVFLESAYSLLFYTILYSNDFEKNSVFVYHGKNMSELFQNSKLKLETIYIPREEYIGVTKTKNIFKRKIEKSRYKKELREKLLNLIKEKTKGYKVEYFGNDNEVEPKLLWEHINEFTVIEDGWTNYKVSYFEDYMKKFKNRFRKKENLKKGLSPKVKKIILSGLEEIPNIIKEKVEIKKPKELWKTKTEEEKEKIYKFFGLENEDLKRITKKKVVFLSQPMEEDQSLTRDETIEVYKKIFSNYNEEDILFKLHPRGVFTYKDIFPKMEVFESKIPFQIFEYMGIEFDTVATVYSTAVWDIKNAKKIDFYGTKIHPKLLEQFGNIEK